jgi:thymidine phosphorylase
VELAVAPATPGIIAAIDARALGLLLVELGGGRRRSDDAIDVAVGLAHVGGVGDPASKEQPMAVIHARTAAHADAAAAVLRRAMTIGDTPVSGKRSAVLRRLDAKPG